MHDSSSEKNILGGRLHPCCTAPATGFFRDGYCRTDLQDIGSHTVCAVVTDDFLEYSRNQGNDLTTPRPEFDFAGLKAGDRWCLCAARWYEAYRAKVAPPILPEATHQKARQRAPLEALLECAVEIDKQ